MSWYTNLQVAVLSGTGTTFNSLHEHIISILDRDGISHELFTDICSSFETGEATCNVHPAYLYQFFVEIAPLLSPLNLEIRCLGEEFRHTWIMGIASGKIDFNVGPWDYE